MKVHIKKTQQSSNLHLPVVFSFYKKTRITIQKKENKTFFSFSYNK